MTLQLTQAELFLQSLATVEETYHDLVAEADSPIELEYLYDVTLGEGSIIDDVLAQLPTVPVTVRAAVEPQLLGTVARMRAMIEAKANSFDADVSEEN